MSDTAIALDAEPGTEGGAFRTNTWVVVSAEFLEDAPAIAEAIVIGLCGQPPSDERYHNVWERGYHAALRAIRSGRLVLEDGYFKWGRP